MQMAFWTTLSFVFGAACSVIAGYVGMWVSIRANIRTASAARTSLNEALQIALRGGAVSGLFVVAMSLLGVGGLYALLTLLGQEPQKIPFIIVGYGFGASFVALFAQLGGGIYTKAADVGADLVGKVEAGIPEDDPRNPAVIADLVGDNVGDCAGRGADLFESTAAENIGAMILGVGLYPATSACKGILFPLVARAFGLIASIIGIMVVKTEEDADPMDALNRGYYVTSRLAAVGFFVASRWLLYTDQAPNAWLYFFLCGVVGIATAQAFVYITQYYTEYKYRPVQADRRSVPDRTRRPTSSPASPSASSAPRLPTIVISIAIIASYYLGQASGGGARRPVRHRRRDHGHARHRRLHPGDGHLRPDHRQRRRHRRNEPAAGGDPQEDRSPRRGRQHDQGADQGICHRLGRARGVPAVLGLPRRGEPLRAQAGEWSTSPSRKCSSAACSAPCWSFSSRRSPSAPSAKRRTTSSTKCARQFRENPGILAGTVKPDYGSASTS